VSGFQDDFDGDGLDLAVWVPCYLPHWSSRETSSATYDVRDSVLRLRIPVEQGLWCEGVHEPPLRVSGIQSGELAGPVGSTRGQQPFVPGQRVAQAQPEVRGWLPHGGRIEVRARMGLSSRSMASVWLVGFEEVPERSGEICVFEVFGDTATEDGTSYAVGTGIHPFRDPQLVDDFDTVRGGVDVSTWHVFAADWTDRLVTFSIGGDPVRTVHQSPGYAMEMMIGVFDFPDRDGPDDHEPWLEVDWVRGPEGRRTASEATDRTT
jgi:hypothetical protein